MFKIGALNLFNILNIKVKPNRDIFESDDKIKLFESEF